MNHEEQPMTSNLVLYVATLKEIVSSHVMATLKLNDEVIELRKTVHELTKRVTDLERKNN